MPFCIGQFQKPKILQSLLRSRSRSEPRFFWAGAGANLKFELEPEPEPIFLGRLRLIFGISEKQNDLRMFIFHCIHYTVHNFVL